MTEEAQGSPPVQGQTEPREPLAALAEMAAVDPAMTRVVCQPLGEDAGEAFATLARVQERERIARDLHDVVIQSLIGIGIHLNRIAADVPPYAIRHHVDEAARAIDAVIGDLRDYIFELRPRMGGQRTFGDAVERMARSIAASTGVEIRVAIDRQLAARLGSHATELVKIIREALSNAIRHGGARHCTVSVVPLGGAAVLTISDDGTGFDVSTGEHGHGIPNMQERASKMGASLELCSCPGGPTTVQLILWLRSPSGSEAPTTPL